MTTMQSLEGAQAVEAPQAALAEIIQFPSPNERGFLNTETTSPFPMEVSDWRELSVRHKRGVGLVETSLVTVSETGTDANKASRFVLRKITPEKQQFAISVDSMPPLGTRVNGYNSAVAETMARRGIATRIVGTNQTHGYNLRHDTQADLLILDAEDRRSSGSNQQSCNPGESLDYGYSMGSMKALAKLALASTTDRKIHLSIGMDPCVADQTGYDTLANLETALYFLADAAQIPVNMYHDAREIGLLKALNQVRRWAGTVGLSAEYLSNTYDKWSTILTGEAGTFIPEIPQDAMIVMHSFDNSRLNHHATYERQLQGFPNARTVMEHGYHLSYASLVATNNMVGDMTSALELIESGASKSDILDSVSRPVLNSRRLAS